MNKEIFPYKLEVIKDGDYFIANDSKADCMAPAGTKVAIYTLVEVLTLKVRRTLE
jgi:hypothetical protein